MCKNKTCLLKYLRFFFYAITVLIMWAIPAKKILDVEASAEPPLILDFPVQGYDPYDPGRGHYLAVRIAPLSVTGEQSLFFNKQYYVTFKKDKNGLAAIDEILKKQPGKGYFLKLRVDSIYNHKTDKSELTLRDFPWKRFYINEELALPAEQILQKQNGSGCRLRVKLYNGGGSVVEDLLVDGKSIRELAKEQLKRKRY